MQCMMKEVCAQCLQKHVDPVTGKETIVFTCFNQDQEIDRVDFENLRARLRANSMQEKLTARGSTGCSREAPEIERRWERRRPPDPERGAGFRPAGRFAHDGAALWTALRPRFGAAHRPTAWFVEHSPPSSALCAALLLPRAVTTCATTCRRIRGRVCAAARGGDVAETFTTYAGCLAEVLVERLKERALPDLELAGRPHMERAIEEGKGVILVTAHTAGWELARPVFRTSTRGSTS